MNKLLLFERIGDIDEALLERSETSGRAPAAWRQWGAAAACFCVVLAGAAALPGLLSHGGVPEPGVDQVQMGEPLEALPDPGQSENTQPGQEAAIYFNEVNELAEADGTPKANFCIFGEPLTAEELEMAAPSVSMDWMDLSGAALYYGEGELESLSLEVWDQAWEGMVSVSIRDAGQPVYPCGILPPESVTATQLGELTLTAYQYTDEYGALLWADFEREGVAYSISVNTDLAGLEEAKAHLADVLYCYAQTESVPDLSLFHTENRWISEALTLEEARKDQVFGSYLPTELPQGFTEESVVRSWTPDPAEDSLSALWTRGYDTLTWRVFPLDEEDAGRVTSVWEKENYDLSLYPIPRGESVPEELWEIVNNPIFKIEELTLDTVYARAYQVDDAGDAGGWRMSFGVLYGDMVVKVNSKGVSPEWVYQRLVELK